MELTIGDFVESGAYADIYQGTDELGRAVAVKLVHGSAGDAEFAVAQAKALARARHRNVCHVYSIENTMHPTTGKPVKAIVLEWIPGITLTSYLAGPPKPIEQLMPIVEQMLDGLEHMHSSGIPHADLHLDNVMVSDGQVKIIDALYFDSLRLLSTQSQQQRYQGDVFSARMIIRKVLASSEAGIHLVERFEELLPKPCDLPQLRKTFQSVTGAPGEVQLFVERVCSPTFVKTAEYADALVAIVPAALRVPLTQQLLRQSAVEERHDAFFERLLCLLDEDERRAVAELIAMRIERMDPADWVSDLRLVAVGGKPVWDLLPQITKLKIERILVDDMAKGIHDAYSTSPDPASGKVGVWVVRLGHLFAARDELIGRIARMLHSSQWNVQNYVGQHLLRVLPKLGDTDERKNTLIEALANAVACDSRLVIENLRALPREWRDALQIAPSSTHDAGDAGPVVATKS